ncbi:MAG TPA: hypothetical protein EYN06_09265 [Myxococcales bacterium]|nr:hypothetical protein [Myxococcales bacterium]HIN86657.1 hypothetical protein [Myxococcales bacterium]
MPIRTGGLATGIDTQGLIKQLVAIESAPVNKLKYQKKGFEAQISRIGTIKSSLLSLKSKMESMDTQKEFLSIKATSSDDDFFTATADGNASIAPYTLSISQLAVAEKNMSQAFAATTDVVKAGTITIAVAGGDAQDITIDEGDTLADVAAKINANASGVSASVIQGATEARLILTADDTGYTVGGTVNDAIVVSEAYTGLTGAEVTLTQTTTAANAILIIDGVSVESKSNDVADAITGVTIKAVKVTTDDLTLKIEKDSEKIVETVQGFVDAFNSTMGLLNEELKVKAKTDRGASLAGDTTIRALKFALSKAVTSQITSLANNKYTGLNAIGIKNLNGVMSLDTTKFNAALDDKLQQVSDLFTVSDGITKGLIPITKNYALSDGVLAERTNGINTSIKNIDRRIIRLEDRIAKYSAQLLKQFTALESTVARLSSQGNYLAQALK